MSDKGPDDLGERIAKAQAERSAREAEKKRSQDLSAGSVSAGAHALRYGVEFVASVFVGGFIGYWIDHFADTAPWGLLIMGAFGFAAGIRAIVRAYRQLNAEGMKYAAEHPAPDVKTDDRNESE